MSKVFVDAHYLIARINPRDEWHRAALEAERRLGRGILQVISHKVFAELLAGVSSHTHLRRVAVQLIRVMKQDSRVKVVPSSEDLFLRGLELYDKITDKEYSLVDCISMVIMEDEGISEILTNDHHFEQERFTTLLKKK